MFNEPEEPTPAAPRPRRRRARNVALALGALVLALAAVAHLPPVRARALDAALSWANKKFGIVARARGLDYNLFTLRFTLDGPTVAAAHTPAAPFFAADRVEVDLPWSWLRGNRSLQALRIDGPRISIATDTTDRFNLPTVKGGARGGSTIDIDELALRDISVSIDDRVRRIGLQVQRASLRLNGTGTGGFEGRLRMGAPGALAVGGWHTTLTSLNATLALQGRVLRLSPLTIGTSDGEISLNGTAGLSADAPLDVTIGAQVHLTRVVSSLVHGLRVGGTLQVSGRAEGTISEPQATLAVRAPAFTFGSHAPGVLTGTLAVTRHAVRIETITVEAPWGGVKASGRISDRHRGATGHPDTGDPLHASAGGTRPGPDHIDFSWRGLDAAMSAAASDVELPFAIAARVGGTGRLEWPAGGDGVTLRAATTVTPGAGRGLPVSGSVRVEKLGPRWTIGHDVSGPGGMHARGRIGVGVGAGPVTLSGDIDAESSDLGLALGSLASAGVRILPEIVEAVRGSARAKVTLSGNSDVPRFDIDATGTGVSYAPLPEARVEARVVVVPHRVRIDTATAHFAGGSARAADLTIDTERERMSGPVSANLQDIGPVAAAYLPELGPVGGALVADGQLGGTFTRPRVATSIEATDVTIAGQRFANVDGDVTYTEPRIEWRSVRAEQASGVVSTSGWYDLDRDEYELEGAARGVTIAPCPAGPLPCPDGIPVDASIDHLAVSAHGTLDRVTGTIDVGAREVRWKGVDAGALVGTASFTDGSGTLAARLPDRGARLAGSVSLQSPRPFDLTLTTTDSSLPDLLRLGGRPGEASRVIGTLSSTVHAVGAFDDLDKVSLEASLPPTQLVVDGRRWHTQQAARVAYGPERVEATGLTLGIGDSAASISGSLDRSGRDTMSVVFEGALDDFVDGLKLEDVQATGHASARLTVSGTPARPLVAGTAEVTGATVTHPKGSVSIDRLPVSLDGGVVRVTRGELRSHGGHATVDASVPVTMAREWLPEEVLRALGTPPPGAHATLGADLSATLADTGLLGDASRLPLAGTLGARLDVEADALSLDALRGRGVVQSADISVGSSRIAQATPGVLSIDRGRVTLEPWTLTGAGSNLVASGSLVLGGDGSLPIAARLDGPLQLEPLQALLGLPISGLLTANVRVSGTFDDPRAEGTVSLANGGLRVRSPRIAIADLGGAARLDGTAIALDGVSGLVNGAPFVLTGSAAFPWVASQEPRSLRFVAQRVAIQPFATGPRAEADLDLTYTDAGGERTIGGRADLLPQPFRGSVLALKQFVDAVAATNAPLGATPRRAKSGTSPIKLNIGVDSLEPMLVDTNVGRVELSARLTVGGSLEQPALLGRVTVLDDGIIRAGGRTYKISSGTIDFTNPRRVVPLINLTATTRISTYAITMIVAGTPNSLRTSLTSDPPLAESDLRSLIVTGRLASDSARDQGESASERQVIESISGDIFGFAAQAIGLDAVSIGNPDLDLLASDIDARTSLNLTKSLSRQLEVVYSRDLQNDRSSWLVIYRPGRSLALRLLSRDNREGAVEFRQEFRFGGPSPARDASARPSAKKPKVTSVSFTGDLGVPEAQLMNQLHLKRGSRFDTWKWRGETEQLARFYRERGFYTARIVPRRVPEGDGVSLVYAVARGPRTTLAIDGHEMPKQVLERMRDAWAESVSTSFLVEDIETIARTHLVDEGYLAPQVRAELPVQNDAALAVLLHVTPGALVRDRAIEPRGVSDAMKTKLEAFLETTHLDRTAWYESASLKAPVESFYREQGYLDAKAAPSAPVIDGDRARLALSVDEGRLYRVARIAVDGADALGDEKVRTATGVSLDAPWQAAFVSQALTNVEGAYHNAGFADTEVYVEPQVDAPAGKVTLYVAVAEGQRQVLQDLAIAGTRTTMTKTVSDLVHLRFGDPITPALVSDVQKRLYDVGVFSRVTVDFTPAPGGSQGTHPYDDPVIAKVTVTEAPRFSLQYGVQESRTSEATGTSAEYKPGAAVDFRDRNFLGRAMGLGVGVRADARQKSARATVTMPRTYGTGIRSYLFMDRSRKESVPGTGFSIEDNTASITAEQRWRKSPRLEYSWGLAYDYQRSILSTTTPKTELVTLTGDTVGPRLAVVFDSRDDPFDAHKGFFHSSGLDLGARFLGSDQAYARTLVQNFFFVPKGPLVFASGLRYGGLFTWGPVNLIQLDLRFDAGGSRSVRGYSEDALSAERFLGVPIGGKQMLVLNEEVRFPIWWWLKGTAFVDAGNTFATFDQLRLGQLKVGAGWGLRLATPLALIRFDAGYPVNDPTRTKPRYYFSIGQAF